MESLASYTGRKDNGLGSPSDLAFEYCEFIAYCRTGARAAAAIKVLCGTGFKGYLWNVGGIVGWVTVNTGYDLVTTVR
jgi:hypothetical protein